MPLQQCCVFDGGLCFIRSSSGLRPCGADIGRRPEHNRQVDDPAPRNRIADASEGANQFERLVGKGQFRVCRPVRGADRCADNLEEGRDARVQGEGELPKIDGADALGSVFVFRDLRGTDARDFRQPLDAHAPRSPQQLQPSTDMLVNGNRLHLERSLQRIRSHDAIVSFGNLYGSFTNINAIAQTIADRKLLP